MDEKTICKAIGRVIRLMRERENMTQQTLAMELIVTNARVSQLESGEARLKSYFDVIRKMQEKYGLDFASCVEAFTGCLVENFMSGSSIQMVRNKSLNFCTTICDMEGVKLSVTNQIADEMKRARGGRTIDEVAGQIGISMRYYYCLEAGSRGISAYWRLSKRIDDILKCDITNLIIREEIVRFRKTILLGREDNEK